MVTGWQIGIDIGGTFTDVVAYLPETRNILTTKVPSRPNNPIAGLLDALDAIDCRWEDAADLVHGTTIVTNAVVENRLARVAFITTEGFADTLAIGRQNRRHLYRLDLPPKAPPLVLDEFRFEVAERLDALGQPIKELTEEAIEEVCAKVAASGADAVAVSLLHSYANSNHEQRLGEELKSSSSYVALSHEVNPESREFERSYTTALSAGVMPMTGDYLANLEAECPEESRLHMFHSAGGMANLETLRNAPLGLAYSGPAAGVSAAAAVAGELGLERAISFDMGGTTADVCLIVDGKVEISSDRYLGDQPLRQPMVAVESIGAGGGSIASLEDGLLRVGPESAGAEPGPACYGKGGTAPTVTDANLVLGYLDFQRQLKNGIRFDIPAAEAALATLADEIGVTIHAAAHGILNVVHATMIRSLRRITVERGVDGRQCSLIAFGGAGPMHAVELARSFGVRQVVVPHASSVLSAVGCLTAERSYTQQWTINLISSNWDQQRLDGSCRQIEARLSKPFDNTGLKTVVSEIALVRYSGQSYAVEIHAPSLDDPRILGEQFREQHRKLYGFATEDQWELVAVRMTITAERQNRMPKLDIEPTGQTDARVTAECWFQEKRPVLTPRFDRTALGVAQELAGPAIVEDSWSTVVLPPGANLTVDPTGHILIDVGEVE